MQPDSTTNRTSTSAHSSNLCLSMPKRPKTPKTAAGCPSRLPSGHPSQPTAVWPFCSCTPLQAPCPSRSLVRVIVSCRELSPALEINRLIRLRPLYFLAATASDSVFDPFANIALYVRHIPSKQSTAADAPIHAQRRPAPQGRESGPAQVPLGRVAPHDNRQHSLCFFDGQRLAHPDRRVDPCARDPRRRRDERVPHVRPSLRPSPLSPRSSAPS